MRLSLVVEVRVGGLGCSCRRPTSLASERLVPSCRSSLSTAISAARLVPLTPSTPVAVHKPPGMSSDQATYVTAAIPTL